MRWVRVRGVTPPINRTISVRTGASGFFGAWTGSKWLMIHGGYEEIVSEPELWLFDDEQLRKEIMQLSNEEVRNNQERMDEALKRLHDMAPQVGAARQIKEFASDMKKNALAVVMMQFLGEGDSHAAAETKARASGLYQEKQGAIQKQVEDAHVTIAKWDATFATFEATRSVGAMLRQTVESFQG